MRSGMGAGEMLIAAKLACIAVAAETAKLGNRLNQSRISAATGLTRREVRALSRLSVSGKISANRQAAKQRTARVLYGWRTDPEFQDKGGDPDTLQVRGPGRTFHSLVRRYGGDVTPVSVLNELVRSGAVTRKDGGRVSVRKMTLRVKGYGTDVVCDVSARLRDVGHTLVNNIENADNPTFVGYQEICGLSSDEAALFQATFSDRAASLVDGIERWRTSQKRIRTDNRRNEVGVARVGLAVYLIGEDFSADKNPSAAKQRKYRSRS
jgi:hypothetical protein